MKMTLAFTLKWWKRSNETSIRNLSWFLYQFNIWYDREIFEAHTSKNNGMFALKYLTTFHSAFENWSVFMGFGDTKQTSKTEILFYVCTFLVVGCSTFLPRLFPISNCVFCCVVVLLLCRMLIIYGISHVWMSSQRHICSRDNSSRARRATYFKRRR